MSVWHRIGRLNDIPQQGARVVKTEAYGEIAIFRTLKDEIHALANTCPHKKGPLAQGIVHGAKVTCPLHNWTFDLSTGGTVGPDEGCAGHFPTKMEGDELFLKLEPTS
ncbi:nitrite reductase small subunit NirD [Magnetococcus sp. PR-3]|uniref:nitrite reductase small subunit NirD n=1 Tax=Magnetococcus sp. PR-3 TaxID=3120355 RepID=UPI002FCE1D2B